VNLNQLIIASTNPVKINAALVGFQTLFPEQHFTARGLSVPSGVSEQPMSDEETLRGAINRASAAGAAQPAADYAIGIEGGCEERYGLLWTFAWVAVLRGDQTGLGRTAAFALPEPVADLVRGGLELGDADDRVFGRSNSKQANGAIGLLTGDRIDRQTYYIHAVMMALVPFKNPALAFAAPEFTPHRSRKGRICEG
jgi:inosine/xanthosine triphosphatase